MQFILVMITFKRIVGLSLVGLVYLSQHDTLVRASAEPIERAERTPQSVFGQNGSNGSSDPSRRGQTYMAHAGAAGSAAAHPLNEVEVRDAAEKVRQISASLESRLPQSNKGEIIRRYLALTLASVDVSSDHELSQADAIKEMMQDPVATADDVRTILEGGGSLTSEERIAVIRLNDHLAGHEFSLPIIERTLQAEVQHKLGSGDSQSAEAEAQRIQVATESFFRHVTDADQRVQFLKMTKEAQADPRITHLLDSRFAHLTQPVQTAAAPAGNMESGQVIETAQTQESSPAVQAVEAAPEHQQPVAPIFVNPDQANAEGGASNFAAPDQNEQLNAS